MYWRYQGSNLKSRLAKSVFYQLNHIPSKIIIFIMYPRNDLNVHDISSVKLKLTLSTNSSTRTYIFIESRSKARVN